MTLKTPKTIAVFTGTRAEYSLLLPTIKAIKATEGLELQLIVGGSHTSQAYGHTIDQIKADGLPIACELHSPYVGQNTVLDAAETMQQLQAFWATHKPDCLLVLGDRHETLAAVTTAFLSRIAVAHIHGGDIVLGGMLDEGMRHAITKLAHLHFPATQLSAERIVQMGEEPWRVTVVGAPAVENIKNTQLLLRADLARDLGLDENKRWLLLTQHPLTLSPATAAAEMQAILDALVNAAEGCQVVITAPNQDEGGLVMQKAIETYQGLYPELFKFVPSLGLKHYLGMLNQSYLVLGNSSSGLLETVCFAKPCLNIGPRQLGRERGHNVLDVALEGEKIELALKALLNDTSRYNALCTADNPFGDGSTSSAIVEVLLNTNFADILNKQFITADKAMN